MRAERSNLCLKTEIASSLSAPRNDSLASSASLFVQSFVSQSLGSALTWVRRAEEGIGLIEKAMRLNPRYPPLYLQSLNFAYRLAGRYEEAIAPAKTLLVLNPNFAPAHLQLASCYAHSGRLEEARAEAAEVMRLIPNYSLEIVRRSLPIKDPAVLERELDAWRKAGLK